jgi:hypothetical protein
MWIGTAVLAAHLVCFLALAQEMVVLLAAQRAQKLREQVGQQAAHCVLPGS